MSLKLPVQPAESPGIVPLAEARITGGMNSRIDPADIPSNVAALLKNARTSSDNTQRSPGFVELAGTKPDSKPVLMYTQYTRFDESIVYLRFSEDRVDKYSSGTYTALTGTLNGTAKDGIRWMVTADASRDYFIFANNGADNIQVLNTTATSFAQLGNAGKYRYVCAFFNRIVAANKVDFTSPNPVLLAWSGDLNFTEWDPLTDISAGSTPLTEAQADYADPITGLFAFASVMLILRERSLWTATKRPVASNPFAFNAAFPSVGCDTPGSASQMRNGIVWYDYRSNQVYAYQVGQAPQAIGTPIRDEILGAITDKDLIWGSYDAVKNTYTLTIPSTSTSISKIFFYNFDTDSWHFDEVDNAYGYYPVDGGVGRLTYDQLTGTYDQLAVAGTYNGIGLIAETPPKNYIGTSTGSIYEETYTSDAMSGEFLWESKIFRIPQGDQAVNRLMILLEPIRSGETTIEYRRNGGSWKTYKTVSFNPVDGRTKVYCRKNIRANEYQWRIRSSTGNFKLLEYKIELSPSLEDK